MITRTITGDDEINQCLNSAMSATAAKMVEEGLITAEQYCLFLDTHVCMIVTKNGGFLSWFSRIWGKEPKIDNIIIVADVGWKKPGTPLSSPLLPHPDHVAKE